MALWHCLIVEWFFPNESKSFVFSTTCLKILHFDYLLFCRLLVMQLTQSRSIFLPIFYEICIFITDLLEKKTKKKWACILYQHLINNDVFKAIPSQTINFHHQISFKKKHIKKGFWVTDVRRLCWIRENASSLFFCVIIWWKFASLPL